MHKSREVYLPLHPRGTTTCSSKGKEKPKNLRRKCTTVAPYLVASSLRRSFASTSAPSPSKIERGQGGEARDNCYKPAWKDTGTQKDSKNYARSNDQCKIVSSGTSSSTAAPTIGVFSPKVASLNSSVPHFRIALTFCCSMGTRKALLSAMAPLMATASIRVSCARLTRPRASLSEKVSQNARSVM